MTCVMSNSTSLDHDKIRQSFKRSLSGYHQSATVQAEIAKTLIDHFLATSIRDNFSHVFEFGCSTGHLSEQLLSRLSINEFTTNDLIEESEQHIASLLDDAPCNWRFEAGAIEQMNLPENLDLIASSSTIQWVFDTRALLGKLTHALAPGGWLMLSAFGERHFKELQILSSKAKAPSYINAEDWPSLIPHNLTIKLIREEEKRIHFKTARLMLSHLRQTGVNGNAGQPWSRQKLRDFETDYEARFKDDDGIYLTYAPVYFIAQKQS